MCEKFYNWLESLSLKKISIIISVLAIAAIVLGFCIGKSTEYSLKEVLQNA